MEPDWWNRTWWNQTQVEPDLVEPDAGGTGPLVEPDWWNRTPGGTGPLPGGSLMQTPGIYSKPQINNPSPELPIPAPDFALRGAHAVFCREGHWGEGILIFQG